MNKKQTLIMLLYSIFLFIFGNDIFIVIINIIFPIFYNNKFESNKKLLNYYLLCIIIFNILYCFCKYIKARKRKFLEMYSLSDRSKGEFSYECATKLFREHKKIKEYIKKKKQIDINIINNITNFQASSFEICRIIYNIIKEYGCDDDCLVTVFQKINCVGRGKSDYVKMIAFAGKKDYKFKSYKNKYSFSENRENHEEFIQTVFYRLFCENEDDIIILHNKKQVKKNFYILQESKDREEKICQYIGIGIPTYRNCVEFILQVDVSKPYVLGYTKEQVKLFANEILFPYVQMLYHLYEIEMLNKTMYEQLKWEN